MTCLYVVELQRSKGFFGMKCHQASVSLSTVREGFISALASPELSCSAFGRMMKKGVL